MPIDDEDFPDIIDIDPDIDPDDIIDDDEDEHFNKTMRDIKRFIKKNKLTTKKAKKLREKKIRELRRLIEDLNFLLLSEAYRKNKSYAGFIKKQDALRHSVLNSLLHGMSVDGKIIVVQDLLRKLEGDDEPTTFYIG